LLCCKEADLLFHNRILIIQEAFPNEASTDRAWLKRARKEISWGHWPCVFVSFHIMS